MFSPAQVEQLLRPVNPRRVQRNDKGMSHLAAYDVSAHLTRIFGFGGWRKEILALELVAEDGIVDERPGKCPQIPRSCASRSPGRSARHTSMLPKPLRMWGSRRDRPVHRQAPRA